MIDREWTMVVAIKFRLRSLCIILERAVQLHDVVCVAWRVRSAAREEGGGGLRSILPLYSIIYLAYVIIIIENRLRSEQLQKVF